MNRQTSFTDTLPRALKRAAGRTATPQVPANIRVVGVGLSAEERALIRQRLGAKLGKYAGDIERVSVRVWDDNGPRGGVDKVCRIKVVLSGQPSVVFEARAALLSDAVTSALTGTERTVRRSVQRQITKPIKVRASSARETGQDGPPHPET